MAAKKGGLGKGLDAIFMENATEDSNHIITLKISEIEPNRTQPRKTSAKRPWLSWPVFHSRHGVLQPLLGCRLWRAADTRL